MQKSAIESFGPQMKGVDGVGGSSRESSWNLETSLSVSYPLIICFIAMTCDNRSSDYLTLSSSVTS